MSGQPLDPNDIRGQLEVLHRESFAWAMVCCANQTVEAEDVLQMSYLKILDGRARYGGRSTFKSWLFGVIRLTASEERRRWSRWLKGDFPVIPVKERVSEELLPDDAVVESERMEQVRTACARLSARQREVMMLVFHHDLDLDDAAAVMGVSPGSARKHYQRGKEHLRRWLGGLGLKPERVENS